MITLEASLARPFIEPIPKRMIPLRTIPLRTIPLLRISGLGA